MKPKVTIVFPIFNGWEDTRDCLTSIKNLNYPKEDLKIIIIDNASTDGSVEAIKKLTNSKIKGLRIKLIENKENLGFAKAVNQGVKKATSELILITNNDVVFEKDCLKELVKAITGNSEIGAVGGKIYWKNQDKIAIDGFRLNPYLGYHQFDLSGLDRKRERDWVPGTGLLTKRKLLLDLGGFDEGYFFYFEDIDFCLRAKKAGFKLLYTPRAILFHGYGRTIFKEKTEKIFYLGYRSRWRCIFKNANPIQILTSSFFLLTLFPLYQSLLTHYDIFKPMLKGLLYNLKDYTSVTVKNNLKRK